MLKFQKLKHICQSLDLNKSLSIGYSGGVDSHVLLHALHQLTLEGVPLKLQAVHVNHHLNPHADQWVAHCRSVCDQLNIPLTVLDIHLENKKGESLEAVARAVRYEAVSQALPKNSYFLTAHHQDDQAETVLLQLLRGAGTKGLSAMPFEKEFKNLKIIRLLLDFTREDILMYAQENQLTWIEDSSNQDTNFQRNYLRQEILPLLKKTWPSCTETISRSAEHCAEVEMLIEDLAEQDFKECVVYPNHLESQVSVIASVSKAIQEGQQGSPGLSRSACNDGSNDNPKILSNLGVNQSQLSIIKLKQFSLPRLKQVIRYWLNQQEFDLPPTTRLNQIITEVLPAKPDAEPLVIWQGVEVRRYRDALYAMKPLSQIDARQCLAWDFSSPLTLPNNIGMLVATKAMGQGINVAKTKGLVEVRFRQGGENCRLPHRLGTYCLKKLFQEWNVPVWERDRIPLIYYQGQLICVVGFCVVQEFLAGSDQEGWLITLACDRFIEN